MPDPLCAQEAQPSQRQWQTRDVPSALWNLCSQQRGQTPQQQPVVSEGEPMGDVGRECSEQEVGPRGSAEEQDQPSCLQVHH